MESNHTKEPLQASDVMRISATTALIVLLLVGIVAYSYRSTILRAFVAPTSESYAAEDQSGQQNQVVNIVAKSNPAVVSVVITKEVPVMERFFRQFGPFGMTVPDYRQNGTQEQQVGGGSGFFVNADGLIVTNRHVVEDTSASYTVVTSDGKELDAKVLARDPVFDIAVLKVEGSGYKYLTLEDAGKKLDLGQTVIAIGNALAEFRNSVSVGVISGLSRSIVAGDGLGSQELLDNVIQTDAAINPGNSGGPLLSLDGKVIGMNVAIAQGSENIGFALPAPLISQVVESIEKNGRIVRPYMGIRYITITKEVQTERNLPVDHGALVNSSDPEVPAIVPNSPAAKAGVKSGDIITAINGKELDGTASLASIVRSMGVGDTVTLSILRNGKTISVRMTLAEVPADL